MIPIRDENPSKTIPFFTIAFIIANILVFYKQYTLPPELLRLSINEFALFPVELTKMANLSYSRGVPPPLTLVSSMFLHAGILHLLGNMWFLWIFGDNIEDTFGHVPFILFYFLCGTAAGLAHVILNPTSTIPTVGASGAISGVLGAYLVLFPAIRVKTMLILVIFITFVRVPAVAFLGLWFALQAMGGFAQIQSGSVGGVAFAAHIGGFIAGVGLTFVFTRWRSGRREHRYQSWRTRRF